MTQFLKFHEVSGIQNSWVYLTSPLWWGGGKMPLGWCTWWHWRLPTLCLLLYSIPLWYTRPRPKHWSLRKVITLLSLLTFLQTERLDSLRGKCNSLTGDVKGVYTCEVCVCVVLKVSFIIQLQRVYIPYWIRGWLGSRGQWDMIREHLCPPGNEILVVHPTALWFTNGYCGSLIT